MGSGGKARLVQVNRHKLRLCLAASERQKCKHQAKNLRTKNKISPTSVAASSQGSERSHRGALRHWWLAAAGAAG